MCWLPVVANLVGILLILYYEKADIVAFKKLWDCVNQTKNLINLERFVVKRPLIFVSPF